MDGKKHSALMLMDTGSNFNILATEMKAKQKWTIDFGKGAIFGQLNGSCI